MKMSPPPSPLLLITSLLVWISCCNNYSSSEAFLIPTPIKSPQQKAPTLFKRTPLQIINNKQRIATLPKPKQNREITKLNNILPSSSLISTSDKWGNAALLTLCATISQPLSQNNKFFHLLGAPVSAMALTFLFASIRILPSGGSPTAAQIQSLTLHLATPLLLLSADLKDCRKRTGSLLYSFLYAASATLIASIVALTMVPACKTLLTTSMGSDGIKIAAALMAKNIGGGVNYIAVCNSLQASNMAIAAGLCVDNIFALLYFPITSALGSGLPDLENASDTKKIEDCQSSSVNNTTTKEEEKKETKHEISVQSLSTILSTSTLLTYLSHTLLTKLHYSTSHALPLSTLLSIILLMVTPSKYLTPHQNTAEVVGTTLLYLFFATAGSSGFSIAQSMKESFLPLGFFLSVLYVIHGGVLFLVRFIGERLFRLSQHRNQNKDKDEGSIAMQRLLTASSASIGGPATAVALAKSNGWNSLIVPSLLVGNLGYAVATFVGILFHACFKS